ncbi:MAG: hypothetical protein SOW25_06115 [Helicobacter sp.]|nr:hypothetical protein [Helicobacteraceae bacterium]MDY3113885.1 hypothetical protein [Helicobacter sp.]
MKIALICDSLLLDRSLELYLKEYLTSYKLCDFVVATQSVESKKPVFLIGNFEGANLAIPFTKEILLRELESFYQKIKIESQNEKAYISSITPDLSTQDSAQQAESQAIDFTTQPTQPTFIAQPTQNIQAQTTQIPQNSPELNKKLEEILRRYAKEIQSTILEHFKK